MINIKDIEYPDYNKYWKIDIKQIIQDSYQHNKIYVKCFGAYADYDGEDVYGIYVYLFHYGSCDWLCETRYSLHSIAQMLHCKELIVYI